MTPEAHQVHIDTLYKKIEELSADCEGQHKTGLEAIQRVHQRIDEFTKVLMQMSEINRDVQSLVTHQKALDSESKSVAARMSQLENTVATHGSTVTSVHRIAWGVAGFITLAIGSAVFKVIGLG